MARTWKDSGAHGNSNSRPKGVKKTDRRWTEFSEQQPWAYKSKKVKRALRQDKENRPN
jgi:hypothetical protein